MTLATQIAADVDTVFLNENDFGEEISYTPVGGSPRTIVAVVVPMPAEIREEGNHLMEHRMVSVLAKNHATTGISSPAKGDTIAWNGKTYSLVGDVDEQMGAFQLRFSCPTVIETGFMGKFRT